MNGKIICVICAFIATALVTSPAVAMDRNWNVGTGNWGASGNWSPAGVPTASDIVYLNHLVGGVRGVVTVSGTGFASPVSVNIRQLNELDIANMSALSIGGDMFVGYDNSVGYFNLNSSFPGVVFFNGNLTVGNTMRLGYDGSLGIANQNDGTVTVNQLVRVGDTHHIIAEIPGTGVYNLSGVGVLNAARLEVGYGGDSSQFACEGTINLSGNATLNVSLGAQIPDPKIGGNGGVGTVNQTGGTLNSPFRIISLGSGASGSGIYNFSGGTCNVPGFGIAGNGTINYLGGSNLYLGQVSTSAGHINLSSGHNKVLRASLLFTSAGAWAIDLNDNAMILNSTLGETVKSAITRGYNGGAWNGNGITSTAARNDGQHKTALGYGLASDIFGPTGGSFLGFPVSGSTNLIRYTYYGDANLDASVDTIDFNNLTSNFGGSGKVWTQGDFNYDSSVDTIDFNLLASNFGKTLPASSIAQSLVPEPGAAIVGFGLGLLLRRRRRFSVR